MIRLMSTAVATAALALGIAFSPAQAATINFFNISNNGNQNVGGQLGAEITQGVGNQVLFKFLNAVGIASSIADIYFADNLALFAPPPVILQQTAGVSFGVGASPASLPGQNNAVPAFVSTTSLSLDSNAPVLANGINSASEFLLLGLNLVGGKTFSDVLAALSNGALRLGLHVQGIGTTGGSDSYVNNPPSAVPLPAGVWLFGTALVGMGALGVKRRRRASAAA
jgi:hypothetical protein